MTDNDIYERKDFDDFLAPGTPPDNSPENLAYLADISPELANFDFSELVALRASEIAAEELAAESLD